MVTLERTTLRRDRAVQRMDRREVDGANRVSGEPFDIPADHVTLELDRQPIWRFINPVAKAGSPWLNLGD